jgi:putative transposase
MQAPTLTDAQSAFMPSQGAEAVMVAETCRKAGIGQAACLNRKKKRDGMTSP